MKYDTIGGTKLKYFLLIMGLIVSFMVGEGFPQAVGDWQSVGNGNWTNNTIWQKGNGSSWVAASAGEYPGSSSGNASGTVYLRSGFAVILDANPANSIGSLTIENGSTTELDINGNVLVATGNVTIDGDIDDGIGGGEVQIGGNFTINNTATWDNSGNGLSITFNGSSGTQTLSGTYSTVLSVYNFTVNASGATVDNNLGADFIISGTFALQAGTFQAGTVTYSLNNGALNPTVFNKTGGTFSAETSTFKINSSQNATMATDAAISFYKIIHAPTGSKYLRLNETDGTGNNIYFTITNSFEISPYSQGVQFLNQALMDYSGTTTLSYTTGNNITIGNEWPATNGPTNVTINSSANFTLGGSRTITGTLTKAGTGTFSIASGSGATLTIAAGGVFALNGGTFDLVDNTNALTINGRLDMGGGTLTLNSGTLTYGANSTLRYNTDYNPVGEEWGASLTVYNVTVQSGTVVLSTGSGARTIQTDLTVNSTLTANNNAISVGNNMTVNGTLTTNNVNISVTNNATLGASASVTTSGGNFSAGGTCYLTDSSTLTTSGGTVSVTGNTTLEASAQISTGAGSITLQADVSMGYGSKLTTTGSALVYGNLTISGGATIDNGSGTGGTLVMGGSSSTAVNVDGTITVYNFTVNKTSGSSVTVSTTSGSQLRFNANGTLYIQQGILSLSSTSQILDAAGGNINDDNLTLRIDNTGTLKTGGTDITGFATFTLADNSTIEFNGTSAEDVPATTLGDIIISNTYASGVNLTGNITLQTNSDITVSSGSRLNLKGYTITHAGTPSDNLNVAGALYTDGTAITGFNSYSLTGTVVFNGSSAETIPAATFTNLTLDNASGASTGGNVTVNTTLTFTNGKLTSTSGNLLTLGVSATATPTATSFVLGPVARETDGSTTSFAFPVGVDNVLRNVTLAFTSAPATSNTITVEANGASSSPTSTLSNIKSVEDDGYWTISTTLSSIPAYTATFKTTGFSPQITSSSNVTMVRGTDPTYNDEAGSSPSTATDQVTAAFASATSFGDYAVGNLTGTYTWDGGAGDGLWSSAANWVGDQVPQTGDIVVFDNSALSGNYSVTYDASVTQTEFQSVSVSPSGGSTITLTLTKNATMNLTASSSALVVGSGGTLVFNGSSVIMGGSAYDATLTDYQSGSTVQYNALVNSNVQSDTYYNLTVNLGTAGQSNGAITVNNNFVNQGSATFTAGGNITVSGTFNNSGTFETPSGQTYTLSVTGNATNSGTVTLSSSGTATFSGDVTLSSGTFTPNADTHVKGNITGSGGSFSTSTGTIILDGTAAQTISGATDISFYNLQVNNSNGISLSQNPTVEGTLTFTSGLITTGSNYITIGTNGNTSGGSSSSYVSGRMRKAFAGNAAGSFTFDTGKGGEYLPVSITFTDVSAAYTVAVEQYNSDPHSDIGNAIDAGTLSAISTVRYWLVDGTGGTPTNPQVTLTWNSNDKVSNLTALDVAQWTGTQWISAGGDGVGDANSGTIQSDALTSTGNYFTFGDDAANGQDNSLPVELASFTANADYGKVVLTWTTQSELNNQGFNIYRRMSNVPEGWQKINSEMIAGQGNASYESNYSFTDKQVAAGRTYEYMLESVSFSGLKVQEKTIQVTIPVPQEFALLNNYPNPFNPTTNLKFRLPENHKVTLSIYDLQGRVIKHLLNSVSYPAGEHVVSWDATDDFGNRAASGVYLYVFQAGKFKKVGKMTLLK